MQNLDPKKGHIGKTGIVWEENQWEGEIKGEDDMEQLWVLFMHVWKENNETHLKDG
jgi:hypothetical protein